MGDIEVSIRALVAARAMSQVGKADLASYACALSPSWTPSYQLEYIQSRSWCGIFNLWCLHGEGLAIDIHWKDQIGFLYQLKQVARPDVGDTAYFIRNQHHAVVISVYDDSCSLVNGNGEGGLVTHNVVPFSNISAFYSIGSLIASIGSVLDAPTG